VDETWLSVPQLAAQWPWGESTIRRWIDDGSLPAVRSRGGHRRVRKSDADAFEANGFVKIATDEPAPETP
jgi:excisionase family DNA binding protein